MSDEIPPTSQVPTVIPEAPASALALMLAGGGSLVGWASWTPKTLADRVAALNAQGEADDTLRNAVPCRLVVDRVMVHQRKKEDVTTGEVKDWWRCVLITTDGRCYSTGSVVIQAHIRAMAELLGSGPWRPAVVMDISHKDLGGGKSTYSVRFSVDGEAPTTDKKKKG